MTLNPFAIPGGRDAAAATVVTLVTSASTCPGLADPVACTDPGKPIARTWDCRAQIMGEISLFERLKSAGLPLSMASEGADGVNEGESAGGAIVALVSVVGSRLAALVATPSGITYRFEPEAIEPTWWDFAARNYYVVTGNMADRQMLALRAGVDPKVIKGRTWYRKKDAEPSGLGLDELIDLVAPTIDQVQADLF